MFLSSSVRRKQRYAKDSCVFACSRRRCWFAISPFASVLAMSRPWIAKIPGAALSPAVSSLFLPPSSRSRRRCCALRLLRATANNRASRRSPRHCAMPRSPALMRHTPRTLSVFCRLSVQFPFLHFDVSRSRSSVLQPRRISVATTARQPAAVTLTAVATYLRRLMASL